MPSKIWLEKRKKNQISFSLNSLFTVNKQLREIHMHYKTFLWCFLGLKSCWFDLKIDHNKYFFHFSIGSRGLNDKIFFVLLIFCNYVFFHATKLNSKIELISDKNFPQVEETEKPGWNCNWQWASLGIQWQCSFVCNY